MLRYRVVNLGQADAAPPAAPPPACPPVKTTPNLNCQRAPDGAVVCSDGSLYPAGCASPSVTTPGTTTYDRSGGTLKVATPPPFDLGQETGTQFPWILVGISAAGLVGSLIF